VSLRRRAFAAAATSLGAAPWLAGCNAKRDTVGGPVPRVTWKGGWLDDAQQGHRLRDAAWLERADTLAASSDAAERVDVVVVGAGVSGLAAARSLMREGIEDLVVLDLEAQAGGNARAHRLGGSECPLGAHYLPVPGDATPELREWLADLGLMRQDGGRWLPDERHVCHAPRERLWFDGQWQEGLLLRAEPGSARAKQYERFARLVQSAMRDVGFALPMHRAPWTPRHAELDARSFASWLQQEGLDDEALLGYLDYACRDDYGGGIGVVSAWAGLHYFSSRHGFDAPEGAPDTTAGDGAARAIAGDSGHDDSPVFTWPEGNAWLTRRLAAPLESRLRLGHLVWRVAADRHGVVVHAWDAARDRPRRYVARHAIVALPLHVAARVVDDTALTPSLRRAAAAVPQAPWLVANLHVTSLLDDREGAAPAWDNVLFTPAGTSDALGYVDASHQSLRPVRGATVLTAYWSFGRAFERSSGQALGRAPDAAPERPGNAVASRTQREALLEESWSSWSQRVVADLARAHPDLPRKLERVDLMRYGHAMALPAPGVRTLLQGLRLHESGTNTFITLAHSDLAGYSVFEEAFAFGHRAGRNVAMRLGQPQAQGKRRSPRAQR
jgi:phytoene dehydrogenase-like protein